METAQNLGPRRIEEGTRGSIREDRNRHRSGLEGSETRLLDRTVARRRQVYVIGDSLLRRLDRPVTRADPENRRVCCLLGAKIRDVDLRLKRILKGAGKNPLIILHVGTNDTARFSLERIKEDYARLGKTLKEIEAQIIFSGILPVPREGQQRADRIVRINSWLREWCYKEGFGMYGYWEAFGDRQLFSRDRLHLSREGNKTSGREAGSSCQKSFKLGNLGRRLGDVQLISTPDSNIEMVSEIRGDIAGEKRLDIIRMGGRTQRGL
uniref:SGNH hydrolase-type esterase domain-containing protein n=1 Tax=Chrysemys picta bellii TaxID=8478 RepID=A0A8C3FFJ1_CHRPI